MNTKSIAPIIPVLAAIVCAGQAYGNDAITDGREFATGTDYQLLGTDAVAFGPGIQSRARKGVLLKLTSPKSDEDSTEGSGWHGDLTFDRIDFLQPGEVRLNDVSDGLTYSAGVQFETKDEFDSQSAIISSRQLGIHYGRLGSESYNSVDLSVRQENPSETLADDQELWSLGVTTGRRFSLTGLEANDPLWTVSLRGQFSAAEDDSVDEVLDNQQWYLSPGLQWSHSSFNLTADVLMPFMQTGELEDEPDYKVRARIQKRF